METVEQRAERIVRQEVICCVSAFVSTLASGTYADHGPSYMHTGGSAGRALDVLCEKAAELAAPVDDYEEAAIQEGWTNPPRDENSQNVFVDKTDGQTWCAANWRELCDDFNIEPYQREVFEHWTVSDWLGRKLEAEGEKVDFDFAGLIVWARTGSGQDLACDGVIQRIASESIQARP